MHYYYFNYTRSIRTPYYGFLTKDYFAFAFARGTVHTFLSTSGF